MDIDVTIPAKYPLAGTITIPNDQNGPYPAILIIAGSGKTDRNGNPRRSIQLNIYQKLSNALTQNGFVVLRYDKRGCGKSKGSFTRTGLHDLIDDATAAVDFLSARPEVDPDQMFIVGHSEGAMIAPVIAKRRALAGIVLLAGAAETLETTMARQQKNAFQEISKIKGFQGTLLRWIVRVTKQEKKAAKLIEKVKQSDKDVIRLLGIIPLNAKWMREHFDYDVMHTLPDVRCPVFAVTGDRDIQVIPDDAQRLAAAAGGPATWSIIPNMNHILQTYDATQNHTYMKLMHEYLSNPNKNTHPELITQLVTWFSQILQQKISNQEISNQENANREGDTYGEKNNF